MKKRRCRRKKIWFIGLQKLPCVEEAFVLHIRSEYIRRFLFVWKARIFKACPNGLKIVRRLRGLRYPNRVFLRSNLVKIWFAAVLCLPPAKAQHTSVPIFILRMPAFMAALTWSSGMPEPPCRTSGIPPVFFLIVAILSISSFGGFL